MWARDTKSCLVCHTELILKYRGEAPFTEVDFFVEYSAFTLFSTPSLNTLRSLYSQIPR